MLSVPWFSPTGGEKEKKRRGVVSYSLAEEVPYEEIVNDLMVYSDGSLGACYLFNPLYIDSMGEGEQENVSAMLGGMMNSLVQGSYAQFVWRKDRYVPVINEHRQQVQSGDPVVHIMTDGRTLHWNNMVKNGAAFGISSEMWLRKFYGRCAREPLNKMILSSVLGGGIGVTNTRKLKEYVFEHYKLESDFRAFAARVTTPLRSIFRSFRQADSNEMLFSLWRFFTGRTDAPSYSSSKPLRSYFGGWDMSRKWGYFAQGNAEDRIVSVISVDMYPGVTYLSMINSLLGVPVPFTIVMNVAPVVMSSAKTFIRKSLRRYETLLFKADPESEERVKELSRLLQDLDSTNNLLLDTEMYIVMEGATIEELNERRNLFLAEARSRDFTLNPEKAALELCYRASMPGFCVVGTTDRDIRLKTENLADVVPVLGHMQSAPKPLMLMKAPYGGVFGYDIFDSRLPAHHGLIIGATGSGKSFTMNLLMLSSMARNPQVFIVDKGGSYRRLTETLKGSYVDTSPKDPGDPSRASFNPLAPKAEWKSRRMALQLILREMCQVGEHDGHGCAIIERLVVDLFKKFELEPPDVEPTLSDAYRYLTMHKLYDEINESRLAEKQNDIRINLGRWTHTASRGNSPWAVLLDNPRTTVSLENDMITFDILGIEGDERLENVMFFVLADLVKRKVMKNVQRHKIIVFDEAWSVLKTKSGAEFLEDLYKTMRKYNCLILAISQSIEDFSNSEVASALIGQTYQVFVLRQNSPADADRIQEVFKLNDGERDIVATLSRQSGYFSEVFLKMSGVGSSRMAIVPSPVEYWLATTDPKDSQMLSNYVKEYGGDIESAVAMAAYNNPHGCSGR